MARKVSGLSKNGPQGPIFRKSRKANPLFWKADLLTCFQGNKKLNDCEVWRLKSSPFLRYRENCDTRKWSVKFRDVRETGPRGLFLESSENSSGPKSHFGNCYPLVSIDWSLNLFSRYQKENDCGVWWPKGSPFLKKQRKLWHPKRAQNVPGLSRNGSQGRRNLSTGGWGP